MTYCVGCSHGKDSMTSEGCYGYNLGMNLLVKSLQDN